MILKEVDAIEVFMTANGRIAIRQDSHEFGEPVIVVVTLDQFAIIEDWVFKNKDEIALTWNNGVEEDS
jgi:hypothetical protein